MSAILTQKCDQIESSDYIRHLSGKWVVGMGLGGKKTSGSSTWLEVCTCSLAISINNQRLVL